MRTLKENDELFQKLMKLKTNFNWKGHQLELTGENIKVQTELAYNELKENTTSDFHEYIVFS
jgi:hypothetical protein